MSFQVSPTLPEERSAALRLFFQHVADGEREARVDRALGLIAQGELADDGLLVCRSGGNVVGAITALSLAGAAGLVWPPQVAAASSVKDIEDALVHGATHWLQIRGAKFAQALLTDSEMPFADPLYRHGFRHTTTLVYKQKVLADRDARSSGVTQLRYQSYPDCDAANFGAVLLSSYQYTLDCPELNDLRDTEDILSGHRAIPGCRLDRWWLAWHEDRPVGVLLTVPAKEPATWEVAYLGLVPEARGRGFGTEMTLKAMAEAWQAAASRLTLTVDARNVPARRMYQQQGFEEFDRREVLLTIFGKT